MPTKAPVLRIGQDLDLAGNRLYNEGTLVPTATGTLLDFADTVDNRQTITITAAATFTTANLAAGREKEVLITTNMALVTTLAFPSTWIWYGSKLTGTILAKEIRLRLRAYGTTDATVRAEWVAQA
jgi:hypothetical protein